MRHSGNMGRAHGGEKAMNKAEAREPKSGHERPAHAAGVGNERKADVRGAQEGGSMAEAGGLSGAMRELREQHPIEHHDHGPHHGTDHHMRHEPMHGMKPKHKG